MQIFPAAIGMFGTGAADADIAAQAGVFELIEDAGEAGVSIRNVQTGTVRWSKGLFRLLGLASEQHPRLLDVLEALVHPSDRREFHETAIAIVSSASPPRRGEFRIVRPNGTLRWIGLSSEIRYDLSGEPREIIQIFLDVTARKDAQLRLESAQRFSGELARAISNVTWSIPAGGRKPFVPLWAELTGQKLSESEGDGWLNAIHPDDQDATRMAWLSALSTTSAYIGRYRLRRADGTFRWFVARSAPVFLPDGTLREWIGACVDIHEMSRGANMQSAPASADTSAIIAGYHLRAARGILNWSVRELAQAAQVTPAVVRRLEESGPISSDDPSLTAVLKVIEAGGAAFVGLSDGQVAVRRRVHQRMIAASISR